MREAVATATNEHARMLGRSVEVEAAGPPVRVHEHEQSAVVVVPPSA